MDGSRTIIIRTLGCLLAAGVLGAESRFPLNVSQQAEVVAILELSSPDADWAVRGREAAVADVVLDGRVHQQIILFAGPERYGYRVSLGLLSPGDHTVAVERNAVHSAAGAKFAAHGMKVEEIAPGQPEFDAYANAPVLFARTNTVGRFSDVPLLLYSERLKDDAGGASLQYTVIFSNEDGGTSTRTLMARWGRATDIEYVYRLSSATGKAIVQGPGHKDVDFSGERDGTHPLLQPVTDNNMIAAAAKDSPLRFRPAPIPVDLSGLSREEMMDRYPLLYAVMAKELAREGKIRPFGAIAGENISDARNYMFVDYSATLKNAALTVLVRTRDGNLYSSDLGRSDVAIHRDGAVRTTVELPPGTGREQISEILFECRVVPPATNERPQHSGSCLLERVPKVFQLREDYTPDRSFWSMTKPVSLQTGRGIAFRP